MRKILFIALLFVCIGINAQRIDKPGEPYEIFCSLRIVEDNKAWVAIDEQPPMYIVDSNNEALHFKSPAAVLSYMSKRGWQFISTGESLYWPLCMFMKKTIKSEDEATKHLYLSEKPTKIKKEKAK